MYTGLYRLFVALIHSWPEYTRSVLVLAQSEVFTLLASVYPAFFSAEDISPERGVGESAYSLIYHRA